MYKIDDIYGKDFDAVVAWLFYDQPYENSSWFLGI